MRKILLLLTLLPLICKAQNARQLLDSAGTLQYRIKNYRKAAEAYDAAFKLPQPYMTYYHYYEAARSHALAGHQQKAFEYLEKVKRMGYVNVDQLQKDTGFHGLRSYRKWNTLIVQLTQNRAAYLKSLDPSIYHLAGNAELARLKDSNYTARLSNEDLYQKLSHWNAYPRPAARNGGIILEYISRVNDTLSRPFQVYLPKSYNANKPNKLLIYLPGGWWGRPIYHPSDAKDLVFENPTFACLNKFNVIEVYPAVDKTVALFRREGYQNIQSIVAQVKQVLNIDDNQVYLAGFSDGGSSAYNIAGGMPGSFAAFYPINGMVADGSSFANFSNRPIMAFSAEQDMYDHEGILSRAAFARKYGAQWEMRTIANEGHFYYPYADQVLPAIFTDLGKVVRNPLQPHITWYTTTNILNRCDWLEVAIDTSRKNDRPIQSDTLKGKDPFNGKQKTVEYGSKFAQVKADYKANTFTIQSIIVSQITLYLHPAMIDLHKPVKVIINGNLVYDQSTSINKQFMLDNFLANFDRQAVYVNKITVAVPGT